MSNKAKRCCMVSGYWICHSSHLAMHCADNEAGMWAEKASGAINIRLLQKRTHTHLDCRCQSDPRTHTVQKFVVADEDITIPRSSTRLSLRSPSALCDLLRSSVGLRRPPPWKFAGIGETTHIWQEKFTYHVLWTGLTTRSAGCNPCCTGLGWRNGDKRR